MKPPLCQGTLPIRRRNRNFFFCFPATTTERCCVFVFSVRFKVHIHIKKKFFLSCVSAFFFFLIREMGRFIYNLWKHVLPGAAIHSWLFKYWKKKYFTATSFIFYVSKFQKLASPGARKLNWSEIRHSGAATSHQTVELREPTEHNSDFSSGYFSPRIFCNYIFPAEGEPIPQCTQLEMSTFTLQTRGKIFN